MTLVSFLDRLLINAGVVRRNVEEHLRLDDLLNTSIDFVMTLKVKINCSTFFV